MHCLSAALVLTGGHVIVHVRCGKLYSTIASGKITGFNRWVGAWCLSVAGPTVAQLEVFFGSDYL